VSLIHVDAESLDQAVQDNPILILDVWASWCMPCRAFAPVFEAAAANNPDVTFAKFQMDASEENQEYASDTLGIQAVPTLMLFKQGHHLDEFSGAMRGPQFQQLIDALRNFDVEAALELKENGEG
jgi:thioredoxin